MPAQWDNPTKVGFTIDGNGDVLLPLIADVSGTWTILFENDDTETFEAINGVNIAVPNTYFVNDEDSKFVLIRPEGGEPFEETVWVVSYSVEEILFPYQETNSTGKAEIVIDSETTINYTNAGTIGAKVILVFKEGVLQLGITHDPLSGEFTWSFAEEDNICILWFI